MSLERESADAPASSKALVTADSLAELVKREELAAEGSLARQAGVATAFGVFALAPVAMSLLVVDELPLAFAFQSFVALAMVAFLFVGLRLRAKERMRTAEVLPTATARLTAREDA